MKFAFSNKTKEYFLLFILLLLALVIRLQFTHQTDYDSYWIHGMAESINIFGYAKWVFHPASLFGYYPMSYPSALMFFLAFFSSITGLTMKSTVLVSGIVFGLIATTVLFLIAKRIGGFLIGYISALIFSISPQIIYYSSNVAAGRFFLILLYLFFVLFFFHFLECLQDELNIKGRKEKNLIIIKYLAFLLAWVALIFMVHRTSQLVILVLISLIVTSLFFKIGKIGRKLGNIDILRKNFIDRYKKWNKWIVIDTLAIIFVLGAYKLFDLLIRERVLINIERSLPKIAVYLNRGIELLSNNMVMGIIIIVVLIDLVMVVALMYRKNIATPKISDKAGRLYDKIYGKITDDPLRYLFKLLLLVVIVLFILQFFGTSFYTPSLLDYPESNLIDSDNPFFKIINFIFNFSTSVTIFTLLAFFGTYFLFQKEDKSSGEIFLITMILLFCSIITEKNYVRLFIIPFFSIVCAYGFYYFSKFLIKNVSRSILRYVFASMILLLVFGSFFAQYRDILKNKSSVFPYEEGYWNTGLYLRSLNCNCSTLTTDELRAAVMIFASSALPGGSNNIYYYVDRQYLTPKMMDFGIIRERLRKGEKVTTLWELPDWIFGGTYYEGRHAKLLLSSSQWKEENQRIILDYKVKYYIHDKKLRESNFFKLTHPSFNKVYDTHLSDVHSMGKGRFMI